MARVSEARTQARARSGFQEPQNESQGSKDKSNNGGAKSHERPRDGATLVAIMVTSERPPSVSAFTRDTQDEKHGWIVRCLLQKSHATHMTRYAFLCCVGL